MTLTALKAGAYLHHLHLHSPDPERLAAGGDRLDEPEARLAGDEARQRLDRYGRNYLAAAPPRRRAASARRTASSAGCGSTT